MSMLMHFMQKRRFPHLVSQHQIDLEKSWWKERFKLYDIYIWMPWTFNYGSFQTTLHGFWWRQHQIQLGPLVIEFRTRGKAMKR